MNLDDLKSINPCEFHMLIYYHLGENYQITDHALPFFLCLDLRDILTSSNSEFPLNVSGLPQIPVQALTARLGSADFGCMNSACSDVGSVNR